MEFLLTWVDGEEVRYMFLESKDLAKLRTEPDRFYTVIELKTGHIVKH